jgi:hypothetical protein
MSEKSELDRFPVRHTDMRRINRASKTLLRIAPESWVGDSNVSTRIDLAVPARRFLRGPRRLNRQMAGLSRAAIWSHLFGFPGPVFDLDLICFVSAGAPFD